MKNSHNDVSVCHHISSHIMEASPYWVSFVQSTLQQVSLGFLGYKYSNYSPKYFPLQLSPWFHNYDPFPMSQFHLLLGQPCRHTLNKWSLSPSYSPSPVPPFSVSVPWLFHIFCYPPHASGQGSIIALTRGRSPSVNDNTHIPKDRARRTYTLVSLTSLMSSLDHLRGFLSSSRDGSLSCAWLQLHRCIIEIHTRLGPCSIWLKTSNVTRL